VKRVKTGSPITPTAAPFHKRQRTSMLAADLAKPRPHQYITCNALGTVTQLARRNLPPNFTTAITFIATHNWRDPRYERHLLACSTVLSFDSRRLQVFFALVGRRLRRRRRLHTTSPSRVERRPHPPSSTLRPVARALKRTRPPSLR
jgi:hypothetical protein